MENMNGLNNAHLGGEAEELIAKHDLSEAAASDIRELLGTYWGVFGQSHVKQLQERWGIASSFSLPLQPEVAQSADDGVPIVVSAPHSEAATVYASLAKAVDEEVSALAMLQLPMVVYSDEDKLVHTLLPNGTEHQISPIELRKLCRSPGNADTLDNLPADLRPLEIRPMGNYAVMVMWSDGHRSLQPYQSFVRGYSTKPIIEAKQIN
eukprot:gnl/MRDRNA2_/MRDRNA2_241524_c0_seq1.p1 gnl/MRDRNA2_/MRDRNA2_241524_c0~~gnl/MRDRNA2_/MRDRNA2_241524_c0_seq1.p1  ORF type:complete len:208 (+),score=35.19 gnl/MRDRNA2_/MRDRNA2_241524_c0_seq1:1-624(+)